MVKDLDLGGDLDLTPSPRILQMLGEIDFEPWQCLAELIDNGIDSYLSALADNDNFLNEYELDEFKIKVLLPNRAEYDTGQGRVVVFDTG